MFDYGLFDLPYERLNILLLRVAAILAEWVAGWYGRYNISTDNIRFRKASLPARFRLETRKAREYLETAGSFERLATCALCQFVPVHFRCAYHLTEVVRDRLLCRIPECNRLLKTPQSFHLETGFSYKVRALVEDAQSDFWVVAMTKRVLQVIAALLYEICDEYLLWCLLPDIMTIAKKF